MPTLLTTLPRLSLLVLSLWAASASHAADTPAPTPTAAAAHKVPVWVVSAQSSAAPWVLEGAVQPVRQATVAAQTAGNVLALLVKAGDRVKAGQRLVQVDARMASAGVAQSEAGVQQAQAQWRRAQTQWERTKDLRQQGYMSQAALDNAEAELRAAEAGLTQAKAGRSQAALSQDFALVNAPFDGVVLNTWVEAGDLAAPGRPLVTVYAPNTLRAVVQVPQSQAGLARQAGRIEVQLPDRRWVSPVQAKDLPSADAVSQTVEWRLDLSSADSALLRPGQTVQVRFSGSGGGGGSSSDSAATLPSRLSAPSTAVLRRGELTAVYLAQKDQWVLRPVRVGAVRGDSVELVAGVQAGDRIARDAIAAGLAGAQP